jgi:hypothetical protein
MLLCAVDIGFRGSGARGSGAVGNGSRIVGGVTASLGATGGRRADRDINACLVHVFINFLLFLRYMVSQNEATVTRRYKDRWDKAGQMSYYQLLWMAFAGS